MMQKPAYLAINASYAQELNTKTNGYRKDNSRNYCHTTLVPWIMAIW
jgi:hypothetical protein